MSESDQNRRFEEHYRIEKRPSNGRDQLGSR
jgi:hypothetical protein